MNPCLERAVRMYLVMKQEKKKRKFYKKLEEEIIRLMHGNMIEVDGIALVKGYLKKNGIIQTTYLQVYSKDSFKKHKLFLQSYKIKL